MLTLRELATLLAALAFWKDEIAQGGNYSATSYFKLVGMVGKSSLTPNEIDQLAAKLRAWPLSE